MFVPDMKLVASIGGGVTDQHTASTRRGVMIVVTAVWALSFLADIFIHSYSPSPWIHAAMMSILGALFGREALGKGNGS